MDFRDEMKAAAGSEGARRATGDPAASATGVPDPVVDAKPTRRRFTAEYKLRILREVERAKEGQIGAVLRREGLFSSHLVTWRRERDRVAKVGLAARRRGPQARVQDPKVKQLEREGRKLLPEEIAAIREPVLEEYTRRSSAYYSTSELWDDGLLDPVDTRNALAIAISCSLNTPLAEPSYGVFRF